MSEKRVILRRIITIGLVSIIMVVVAWLVINWAEQSRSELPRLGKVPPFNFVKQDGTAFGQNDFIGKITIVDFMFTRCLGPCPIMSGNMVELYELYRNSDKIQLVSISVDPEYDSVAVLSKYSKEYGVYDDRWVFLHGMIEDVKTLSENGFMLAADDLPASHSTKFILVDEGGNIRGYYTGTEKASINVLKTHINQLVKQIK